MHQAAAAVGAPRPAKSASGRVPAYPSAITKRVAQRSERSGPVMRPSPDMRERGWSARDRPCGSGRKELPCRISDMLASLDATPT
jgi:hypothetical protein